MILLIGGEKGGSGKSCLAQNLAIYLKKHRGMDVLILDALRTKPHPTHFCLDEAVDVANRVGAKQTYLTHLSHEFDYASTNRLLPDHIQLAYDGLRIPLSGLFLLD